MKKPKTKKPKVERPDRDESIFLAFMCGADIPLLAKTIGMDRELVQDIVRRKATEMRQQLLKS